MKGRHEGFYCCLYVFFRFLLIVVVLSFFFFLFCSCLPLIVKEEAKRDGYPIECKLQYHSCPKTEKEKHHF